MLMKQSETVQTTDLSNLADRVIMALFILMVLLGSSLFLSSTALASSSSIQSPQVPLTGFCNNPYPGPGGHCYAQRLWTGHTGAANTLLNPYGAMSCPGCSGFITDEMWFSDPNSSPCQVYPFYDCWVEAGFSTYVAGDSDSCNSSIASVCGYWADNRPYGGGYHETPLYYFGPDGTNLLPYYFYVTILNDSCCSSSGSTWNISTNIYKNGSWIAGPSGQSQFNDMNVDDIEIGSELADSRASAGVMYFQYNQWMDSSGVWHYQTTQGRNNSTNSPPVGNWSVSPCNCNGNTGGSFYTYD